MGFKIVVTSMIGLLISITGGTGAFALENQEICTGTTSNRYICTSEWGYVGEDPYDVDRFSTIAPDGSKHGCTSFAAFMLSLFNPWMPAISNFDSARYADTDAATKTNATLGYTPHMGDIAQWNLDSGLPFGHVAYVKTVFKNSSGAISYIVVADDNGGRLVTTARKLYPGVTSGTISWPDTFITFPTAPIGGGGGGGHLLVTLSAPIGGN